MLKSENILLLDIEGTITSITFVKDVLFPYVRHNLRKILEQNWDVAEFQEDIDFVRTVSDEEIKNGDCLLLPIPDNRTDKTPVIDAVCHNVGKWMDKDKKITVLKQLQGHVWRKAYEGGLVKGHLYPDVVPTLRHLSSEGVKIYIYSSGSVEAQKLLFSHSIEGDITDLISGYFDTNVGLKTECQSYKEICKQIDAQASNVVFLTDVEREAYPCQEAGCSCILVIRPGNELISDKGRKDFQVIDSLKSLI